MRIALALFLALFGIAGMAAGLRACLHPFKSAEVFTSDKHRCITEKGAPEAHLKVYTCEHMYASGPLMSQTIHVTLWPTFANRSCLENSMSSDMYINFDKLYGTEQTSILTNEQVRGPHTAASERSYSYMHLLNLLSGEDDEKHKKRDSFAFSFLRGEADRCARELRDCHGMKEGIESLTKYCALGHSPENDDLRKQVVMAPIAAYSVARSSLIERMYFTYITFQHVHRTLDFAHAKPGTRHRVAASHLRAEIYALLDEFDFVDRITAAARASFDRIKEKVQGADSPRMLECNNAKFILPAHSLASHVKNGEVVKFYPSSEHPGPKTEDLLKTLTEKQMVPSINKAWENPKLMHADLQYLGALFELVKHHLKVNEICVEQTMDCLTSIDVSSTKPLLEPIAGVIEEYIGKK
ncbi:uncharacterized protein NEMAJ01_2359, partial [Nematocida major]|uniref:uncharacterized protein n=1 Tax=Nematocida major TaxID=1912982 RepID=UPI002007F24C